MVTAVAVVPQKQGAWASWGTQIALWVMGQNIELLFQLAYPLKFLYMGANLLA